MSKLCGIDKEKGALHAPRALGTPAGRLGRWDIPQKNALKERDSRINFNGSNNINGAGTRANRDTPQFTEQPARGRVSVSAMQSLDPRSKTAKKTTLAQGRDTENK